MNKNKTDTEKLTSVYFPSGLTALRGATQRRRIETGVDKHLTAAVLEEKDF